MTSFQTQKIPIRIRWFEFTKKKKKMINVVLARLLRILELVQVNST